MKPLWGWVSTALLAAFLAACGQTNSEGRPGDSVSSLASNQSDPNSWPMGGQNYRNTRSNNTQTITNITNVSKLALKWKLDTDGDVSATPAVVNGAVYFPDWAGFMYKVDAKSGQVIWKKQLPVDPFAGQAIARTSPAVEGSTVYIGDQNGYVLALDASTGAILWRTLSNTGPFPIVTQSPVVYNGVVYVGTASAEENVAADPTYTCCFFRGSFQALKASTGAVLWQTYMTPEGYSGAGVWSSTPALDPASNTVYISTGNNYSIPQEAIDCFEAAGSDPVAQQGCVEPSNFVDSIIALDMSTGAIKWATSALIYDNWNVACIFDPDGVNCPEGAGPDFDFGSGPNLLTASINGKKKLVVGAGQKSGQYWLLDAATGQVIWNTQVGPGSPLGGIEWGTATDGKRIYVAIANLYRVPYTDPALGDAGSFAALDPSSGAILWQTKDPNPFMDLGAVSVSNGVVYAGSMSGHMYALDAANGRIAWSYLGNGSSNAGPAIDNSGIVYWGNGYERFGLGTAGHAFYAFSQGVK